MAALQKAHPLGRPAGGMLNHSVLADSENDCIALAPGFQALRDREGGPCPG